MHPNPIRIVSQNFYKELSTAPVSWLLANVGDKIRVETIVKIANYNIASTEDVFIMNNRDGLIGDGWVTDPDGGFKDVKVGDTVYFWDNLAGTSAGTYTVIAKQDDGNIQFNTDISGYTASQADNQAVLSVTTAITALKYHFNFIENGSAPTFISVVDGSEQMFVTKSKLASDTTVTPMLPDGPLTWQSGNVTIEGVSVGVVDGVHQSVYKIIHYTKVTPYLLYNVVDDQLAGIPYKDFRTTKCWKFISMVEAAEVYSNPNFLVTDIFDSNLGNSGWYNENYNTGKTNYSISGVGYTNAGTVIDSVKFDASETTITFDIVNTTDTPFSNNNTKFVLGFFKIPADPIEYQNNNTLLDKNFLYDRALQTLGSAAVNGDNYGGGYQVLKGVSAVFTSSSIITVTAKIAMGVDVLASFQNSSLPQYFLFCSIQNHTKVTADAFNDLVTLQVDINTFTVISTDKTMIVADNVFIRHPEADPATEGVQLKFGKNSLTTKTIVTGTNPLAMAVSITNNKLYITNESDNSITVVNAATNAILTTIDIAPFNANYIAYDSFQDQMYVSDIANNKLVVIECATDTIVTTINIPSGCENLSYSPINKNIYVCSSGNTVVRVINTISNTISGSITVGSNPYGISYNTVMNTMYVPCLGSDNVSVIDCDTNTVISTIPLVASDGPIWATYNSFQNLMYISCSGPSEVKVIDCSTNTVLSTISSISGNYNTYNSIDNQLICSNELGDGLIIIDCLTQNILSTIALSNSTIYKLFDPVNYKIFISNLPNNYVWAISTSFDVYPEDEIVACSNFYIESLGRETDVIKLTSVNAKIVSKNILTGDEFELDQFIMQLGSIPLTGYTQQFDAQVARAFHIPTGTIRKYIEVKRRNDLDTSTRKYFSANYPFLFRWETWTQALGIDSYFFDPTLPNNGFNEWWYRYDNGRSFELFYKLVINATKNGTPQQYTLYNRIVPHDYNSNPDWTAKTITTFDPDTMVSLTTGGNTYISGYKDTLVVATFTKTDLPSNCTVIIGIEAFEQGGIYGKRRYSSKWVADTDTWFKSLDGSGKVVLSIVADTLTAKCLIDYTLLPQGITAFKLSARIYDGVGNELTTDDGVPITTDDGVTITID